ncbi:hypothetical protein BD309DRAFT_865050, partial [Dichomitus squalens]
HTSHLPVSNGGRSQPSRGLGFKSGCSGFQYKLSIIKVSVCLGAHDPQVTWYEKTVTGALCHYTTRVYIDPLHKCYIYPSLLNLDKVVTPHLEFHLLGLIYV